MTSDPLAEGLRLALAKAQKPGDQRFIRSLLAQHESGRMLSKDQMYWAKRKIAESGQPEPITTMSIDKDIFANQDTTTQQASAEELKAEAAKLSTALGLNFVNEQKLQDIVQRFLGGAKSDLTEENDKREASLVARQESFNRSAARTIAEAATAEALRRLDARVPRQVIIKVERDGQQRTVEGIQHPNFEKLMRYLGLRKPDGYAPGIFLAGERGSGKTTGCRNAAKAFGLHWYSNGAISDPVEMLGYNDANGNYHTTPFRQAYEFGGLYTFDEVDRSDPSALLAVNPHLANGEAAFPDGMIKRHKNCLLTATGNTWGLGGSLEFSGACKLDEAFLSRYEIKLSWDVDLAFERKIVGNDAWMDYVQRARQRVKDSGIKYTIDSRAALAGAAMIQQLGYTFEQAAADTYLASMKKDQREMIQQGGIR